MDVAGAADALTVHLADGEAGALCEEAFVVVEEVFFYLSGFFCTGFFEGGNFGAVSFGTLIENGDFFINDSLSFRECGFGISDASLTFVRLFHELEFLSLEFVDHFLVAYYFCSEFIVFVVFLSLELLDPELLDGGFACLAIEVEIFSGDLIFLISRFRVGKTRFVIGKTLTGESLLFRDALEVFLKGGDLLIKILNPDELLDVFAHAREVTCEMERGKC